MLFPGDRSRERFRAAAKAKSALDPGPEAAPSPAGGVTIFAAHPEQATKCLAIAALPAIEAGALVRHLKLRTAEDIEHKKLAGYLPLALGAAKSGV